jgi:hypothetical protein
MTDRVDFKYSGTKLQVEEERLVLELKKSAGFPVN